VSGPLGRRPGDVLGDWTLLAVVSRGAPHARWKIRCRCGLERVVVSSQLSPSKAHARTCRHTRERKYAVGREEGTWRIAESTRRKLVLVCTACGATRTTKNGCPHSLPRVCLACAARRLDVAPARQADEPVKAYVERLVAGAAKLTQTEMARLAGVSRERVRQILADLAMGLRRR